MRLQSLCLSLALALIVVMPACATPPVEAPATAVAETRPAWLDALVVKIESQPVTNPPASVVRYVYQGKTVYYLPPKCCDFPSQLLDAEGARLCNPSGGFTGRGDGQCANFHATATEEKLIWKDAREREPRR